MHPLPDGRQSNESRQIWAACGLLLLAVAAVYGQSLSHILLDYDDGIFVSENPHVSGGLSVDGLRWAFTDGPGGEWYPLTMLSHMLDCQIFGLQPWGHHLINVLLHAASTIGLFLVWRRMTGELWPSAFVAAVFAVHPQHVESVAWVAERKDALSGLLFMLTLGAYLGYTRHGRSLGRYLLVAATFSLGLLAKPMLVTVPPLLLLLDFWPLARFGLADESPRWTASVVRPGLLRLILEKLPLLGLAAGDALITMRTHDNAGVMVPLPVRLGNGVVSCVTYIAQMFVPVDLAAFYPSPPGGPAIWKVAGAGAIVLALCAAAVVSRRRCPYFFVGWFWYLGMLFPTLGLAKVAWFSMADRYMYLPGIGLYVALTWGAVRLAARVTHGRLLLIASAAAVVGVLTAAGALQTSFWRNDETLWGHALACTTDNVKAEVGFADALMRRGELGQANSYYRRAIQHPIDFKPFMNMGLCLARMGEADEAIRMFRRAVEIQADSCDAQCSLALALAAINQFDESRMHFNFALKIDPNNVNAHCGMAVMLRRAGQLDEARAEFERALELDPRKIAAHVALASLLAQQGQFEPAIRHFQAALEIDRKQLKVQIFLARALAASGRTGEAMDHYRQALDIDPNNSAARDELAKLQR